MSKTRRQERSAPLKERLAALRDALLVGLVERDTPVRLSLLASLTGEHLLLIGPPGTAKSLIARRLRLAFRESRYFERLLTRFSVPEELFGPLSVRALEEDRYVRQIEGYLPTASIAFLDEIFKANSAILNALLTLLNERQFDNGTQRISTPLVSVVGASNELPEGEELAALYDRFLLRLHVGPVSDEGFGGLLGLRGEAAPSIPESLQLSGEELSRLRAQAQEVTLSEDVQALLQDLRRWMVEQQIPVSDRRWRKIVSLLQMSALTEGRSEVSVWDAWLLQHCTWSQPEQREAIYDWYAARVGAGAKTDTGRLERVVSAWEGRLEQERASKTQVWRDGQPLFLELDGKFTTQQIGWRRRFKDGEPLYKAPEGAHNGNSRVHRTNHDQGYTIRELQGLRVGGGFGNSEFHSWSRKDDYLAERENWMTERGELPQALEPTRFSEAYIQDCLRQLREQSERASAYLGGLRDHIADLNTQIDGHLWITPGFAAVARRTLEEKRASVEAIQARLASLEEGFEGLPRKEGVEVGT